MKITLSTLVEQHFLKVKDGFNEELFSALNPPFPPVKLLRFDGSKKGDLVSLELNFFIFKQIWTSEITEDLTNDKGFYFIDEGKKLPFFLKKWKHTHRILPKGPVLTEIRDEIEYSGHNKLMNLILYPALYFQFSMRKPIYKSYFSV